MDHSWSEIHHVANLPRHIFPDMTDQYYSSQRCSGRMDLAFSFPPPALVTTGEHVPSARLHSETWTALLPAHGVGMEGGSNHGTHAWAKLNMKHVSRLLLTGENFSNSRIC